MTYVAIDDRYHHSLPKCLATMKHLLTVIYGILCAPKALGQCTESI